MSKASSMSVSNSGEHLTQLKSRIAQLESKEAQYLARIKELEEKSKAFQKERDDDTFRNDMAKDGKIDIQPISKEMAQQTITSFNQHYDADTIDSLHGDELIQYQIQLEAIQVLKEKFNL